MRAVEYCTMNVLKHKWHFWCIKLRVIVHNLLSSTIKLNGLWNQSEMWKETHLYIHISCTIVLKDQTNMLYSKCIICKWTKNRQASSCQRKLWAKKHVIFYTFNTRWKSIASDDRLTNYFTNDCFCYIGIFRLRVCILLNMKLKLIQIMILRSWPSI